MTTVQKWTGRETRALREALRMSTREFAARLGITERTAAKWEAPGKIKTTLRPTSHAMLDTMLNNAPQDARTRFETALATGTTREAAATESAPPSEAPGSAADFTTAVEQHMHARGMSVRATARAAGYSDHTLLSKVLNGHKDISPHLAVKLDRALGANGEIIAAAEPDIAATNAARNTALARTQSGVLPLPSAGAPGNSPGTQMLGFDRFEYVERRISREELIAAVAAESQEFGEWAGMSEVADATIEHYAGQARRLARDFEFGAPLLPLLLETRRLRDRVTARLRGHARLDQTRELYLLAAQVCGLLAWQTGDLGNYRAADTHAWTAWMCAEQAGHDGARAWVRATQAKLAYWDGRFTESAQLAEDGLRYAATDSARVFLTLFQARTLARAGQRDDARQALGQSSAEQDRASAPDLLGGIWGMTEERYHGLAASVDLLLELPDQVLTETARVITISETAPAGKRHMYSWAHAHIDAAMAHLLRRDLDGAIEEVRPVFRLSPDGRNDTVLQHLSRFRQQLALPEFADAPAAVSMQEEIEAYQSESLPRQLGA
jgi:plasmid maintenance system antidote protein VapI